MCNREESLVYVKENREDNGIKVRAKASEDALYFSRKIIRKGGTSGGHVKINGSLRTAEEAAKKRTTRRVVR